MLYATNRFPGDGMTTQYEISFVGGYLDRAHVKAYVEGADLVQTPVTLSPGNFLGQYTIGGLAPVPVGSTLVIYRDTPKAPIVDFVNGSRFTESNLDTATRQGSFIAAEGADAVSPAGLVGVIQQIADFSGAAGAARGQAVAAQNTAVAASDAASLSASNAKASAVSAADAAAIALNNKNLSDTAAFNASSSAALAQGFRNTAGTHATNAGNSATAAAGSATTASNAQAAVATSAANAAASASAAATSASQVAADTTTATTKATEAAASALSAGTSATQSANSATAAGTAKTAAETARASAISSATNAGTSASTATTQAGIATTKASEAAASAVAAGASQTAAAASAALAASYVDPVNPNWNDPKIDSLNGGSLAGFRNVIINGDMKVRQRAVQSITVPTGGIPVFTADRWRASKQGTQTVIFEHVATGNGVGRARECVQLRSTTVYGNLAGDFNLVEQRVEGFEAIRLRGTTFILSFLVKATRPGTYTVAFRNAAGGRSYLATYTVSNSNVWQPVTITITGGIPSGDGDGTGATQWNVTNGVGMQLSWIVNGGSTYASTLVNQWISDSKAVAQGQTQGLQANGDTFAITEVQLEVGTKRTPFERRHMAVETALCQRYFEVVSIAGGARGGEVGSLFVTHTPYAVVKRGASVITPRVPQLSEKTQPPTFNDVAPSGVFGLLRASSTAEFYYVGLVEADSEL